MSRSGLFMTAFCAVLGLTSGSGADQLSALAPPAELKPPHSARIRFDPLHGEGALIKPGAAFGITVEIVNEAGPDAPAGLTLFGWLRRMDPANLPCNEAAEAYLRTGRLPVGTVFLNDPLVAMLTEDNAVHLVDPEFSLATANILSAVQLSSRPGEITIDPQLRRLLVTLPQEGRVLSVDTVGRTQEVASGLAGLTNVVPVSDGSVIVLAEGRLQRLPEGKLPDLPAQALPVQALIPVPGFDEALSVGPDKVTLFDRQSGETLLDWSGQAQAAIPLADASGVFGIAMSVGQDLLVRFRDVPEEPVLRIALAAPASALVQSRDGRFVFAHDPQQGPVSVVDLARMRLVQVTRAGDTAISEIVSGARAAYLMLADQSRVGVLDLKSLARGEPAEFREIPLGEVRDPPLSAPGFLSALWPDSGVIAVHRDSGQGYRLEDFAAMGNAPAMSAIPLRGGVPRGIFVLDRSFEEGPTGSFRTVTALPDRGRWEMVATTGIGQLSFCAELPVADPGDPPSGTAKVLAVETDRPGAFQLRTVDADGQPMALRGRITFAALSGAWRDHAALETDASGLSLATYELPPDDPVVMTIETLSPPRFDPLLIGDPK